MAYNPDKAKEMALLPPDTILDGVITSIEDGVVKTFVSNLEGWKGDINATAINVGVEVKSGGKLVTFTQLFTYKTENDNTVFTPNSNLGKFNKKYGTLPKVGGLVKVITDNDSFCKVKLD